MDDTPTANVAFTGVVADEINRLNREIRMLRMMVCHIARAGIGPIVSDAVGHGCQMCTKALRLVEEEAGHGA